MRPVGGGLSCSRLAALARRGVLPSCDFTSHFPRIDFDRAALEYAPRVRFLSACRPQNCTRPLFPNASIDPRSTRTRNLTLPSTAASGRLWPRQESSAFFTSNTTSLRQGQPERFGRAWSEFDTNVEQVAGDPSNNRPPGFSSTLPPNASVSEGRRVPSPVRRTGEVRRAWSGAIVRPGSSFAG